MDFDVIVEYMPMYVKAFFLTVKIGWIGIVLSLLIGIVAAFILHFKIPVLAQAVKVYVEIFRNTPLSSYSLSMLDFQRLDCLYPRKYAELWD